MIRKALGFLFVAGSVALIACGSDDDSSKYPSTDSFCAALAEAECTDPNAGGQNAEATCPVADGACLTARKAACAAAVSTATAQQGRAYASGNVDACLAATKVATTSPTIKANLDARDDACARVFAGTKAKGSACSTKYDCQGTLACDLGKASPLCEAPVAKAVNEPCADQGDICNPGLYCASVNGNLICQAARTVGQACTPSIPCDTTTTYCNSPTSGVCTALGAPAAACTSNDQCSTNFCNPTKKECSARLYASENGLCSDYGGTD